MWRSFWHGSFLYAAASVEVVWAEPHLAVCILIGDT